MKAALSGTLVTWSRVPTRKLAPTHRCHWKQKALRSTAAQRAEASRFIFLASLRCDVDVILLKIYSQADAS